MMFYESTSQSFAKSFLWLFFFLIFSTILLHQSFAKTNTQCFIFLLVGFSSIFHTQDTQCFINLHSYPPSKKEKNSRHFCVIFIQNPKHSFDSSSSESITCPQNIPSQFSFIIFTWIQNIIFFIFIHILNGFPSRKKFKRRAKRDVSLLILVSLDSYFMFYIVLLRSIFIQILSVFHGRSFHNIVFFIFIHTLHDFSFKEKKIQDISSSSLFKSKTSFRFILIHISDGFPSRKKLKKERSEMFPFSCLVLLIHILRDIAPFIFLQERNRKLFLWFLHRLFEKHFDSDSPYFFCLPQTRYTQYFINLYSYFA